MANHEIITSTVEAAERTVLEHQLIIDGFRRFYDSQQAIEFNRLALIAHHDPTLHFTNSTTSVMKPIIRGERSLEETTYLAQPAMGSQGINAWQQRGELGLYSSYFVSLGSLYQPDLGTTAGYDMIHLVTVLWGIDKARLKFNVHFDDPDVRQALLDAGVSVEQSRAAHVPFRHSYGLPTVSGRNANLVMTDNVGTEHAVGSLTLIEGESNTSRRFWEVSFDSTNVAVLKFGYEHPIASLPAFNFLSEKKLNREEVLVAADCSTIVSALMLEGLEPKAKGKAGIMRKFFKEYVSLTLKAGVDTEVIVDILLRTIKAQKTLIASLSPAETDVNDDELHAYEIANSWTRRLIAGKTAQLIDKTI